MPPRKRTSAKKTAASRQAQPRQQASPEPEEPKGMDPDFVTTTVSTPISGRKAYALETLISEVDELFRGAPYTVSGVNGRGVALTVEFAHNRDLGDLLHLTADDPRVAAVFENEEATVVLFANDARTQDLRDPFNLAEAYNEMGGEWAQTEPDENEADDSDTEDDQ